MSTGENNSSSDSKSRNLRPSRNVDYSCKKPTIFWNPFSTGIKKEKEGNNSKCKTSVGNSHQKSKAKLITNPFAIKTKEEKTETRQLRTRSLVDYSYNKRRLSSASPVAIKRLKKQSYNLRVSEPIDYSESMETEQELGEDDVKVHFNIKTEVKLHKSKYFRNNSLPKKVDTSEKPCTIVSNEEIDCQKDSVALNTNSVHYAEYSESSSTELDEMIEIELIKVEDVYLKKSELLHDSAKESALLKQDTSDSKYPELFEDECNDDDVQYIPKQVVTITINEDCEDENIISASSKDSFSNPSLLLEDGSSTNCDSQQLFHDHESHDPISNSSFDLDQKVGEDTSNPSEVENKSIDELVDDKESVELDNLALPNQDEGTSMFNPEKHNFMLKIFRDRNDGHEVDSKYYSGDLNLRRYVWEMEHRYLAHVHSRSDVPNEVGSLESLTADQLEHPYYKNYQPEPELSEYELEQIELEKDRICEEASGFNNHLWRRPPKRIPLESNFDIPVPRCPDIIYAFTPGGQRVDLHTYIDRPPIFRTEVDRRLWDLATTYNFNRYRCDIEEGDIMSHRIDVNLERRLDKFDHAVKDYFRTGKKGLSLADKSHFLNELELLYLDRCLKNCLPDLLNHVLALMDKILNSPIYIFSLIKYVEVFVSINKTMHQNKFGELKLKAILLYEKIKSVAILEEGESIEDHIFSRAKRLLEYFKDWDTFDYALLTKERAEDEILKQINHNTDFPCGVEGDQNKEALVDGENNETIQDYGEGNSDDDDDSVFEDEDSIGDDNDDGYYEDDDADDDDDDDDDGDDESSYYSEDSSSNEENVDYDDDDDYNSESSSSNEEIIDYDDEEEEDNDSDFHVSVGSLENSEFSDVSINNPSTSDDEIDSTLMRRRDFNDIPEGDREE